MTNADKKIEALNRITREVKKAMPYWNLNTCRKEELIIKIIDKDIEVRSEIESLIETIINEIEESDES